jgi:hypothetical protein
LSPETVPDLRRAPAFRPRNPALRLKFARAFG